jgi:hypothetical protein
MRGVILSRSASDDRENYREENAVLINDFDLEGIGSADHVYLVCKILESRVQYSQFASGIRSRSER